jgi:hypothetical protein
MIALCTVLCGGQGAVDMAEFAKAKEPYLRGFLQLKNGLPSHDTFSRLFRHLDPAQFRATFQGFMRKFAEQCQGVVAIDGKVLRRSFDRASGKSALHMAAAGDIVLLCGDESEALTHPYLARAWANPMPICTCRHQVRPRRWRCWARLIMSRAN